MVFKRSNLIIAAMVAVFSFVAVAYMSCSKPGTIISCSGSLCQNGGYCSIDTATHQPKCTCPTGFEGPTCATPSANKFFGTWMLYQKILGSDSSQYNGDSSIYAVNLVQSSTPTTFIIDNFYNNPFYNNIVCTLDSIHSDIFYIDTISAFHMVYNHFIMRGGYGQITPDRDTIRAILYITFKNKTSNWENDTVRFIMYGRQN